MIHDVYGYSRFFPNLHLLLFIQSLKPFITEDITQGLCLQ